jgi:hypothetical protein
MRTLWKVALVALLAAVGLVGSAPNAGAFERITRGDAQSAFEGFWTAGFIVETKTAAPGFYSMHDTLLNSFHEDTRICTTNWHAYALGWGVEGTHQDAVAEMALLEIDFEIDGVPVPSDTTAIKANTFYGDPLIYAWSDGALIEPGSHSIGAHTLTTIIYYDGTVEELTVTFYVDAEGTGACL